MRYLVTGAAGLIGTHLCEHLVREGHDVYAVDDESTGTFDETAAYAHAYVRRVSQVAGLDLRGHAPMHGIFHLAGHVGVQRISHPERRLRMLREHPEDALVISELSHHWSCPVIAASSSEVYGSHDGECYETQPVQVGPTEQWRSGYAVSKLAMEHLFMALHPPSPLHPPAVLVRLFNVTGPRQRADFALPRFVRAAIRGEALELYGTGGEQRCYGHVADVVRVLAALIHKPTESTVINVGHRRARTTAEVIEDVTELAKRRGHPEVIVRGRPSPAVDGYLWMKSRVPNLDRLEGYGLAVPDRWEELLRDLFAYWEAREGKPPWQE